MTLDMLLRHYEVERCGRGILQSVGRDSGRSARVGELFRTLHEACPWLTLWSVDRWTLPDRRFGWWADLLPKPKARILEIGSGTGELANWLAHGGYEVVATDPHPRFTTVRPGVRWRTGTGTDDYGTDFDAVIAWDVLQFMRQAEAAAHFAAVFRALRPHGAFILATPNAAFGPSDISAVFGADRPAGLHLHEWRHQELGVYLRRAGFDQPRKVLLPPPSWRRWLNFAVSSSILFNWASRKERKIAVAENPKEQALQWRSPNFASNIVVKAVKPRTPSS